MASEILFYTVSHDFDCYIDESSPIFLVVAGQGVTIDNYFIWRYFINALYFYRQCTWKKGLHINVME